jgi:adenine phosphoribosyltransferase
MAEQAGTTTQRDLIESAIRAIPNFPKPGILFRDITPLLQDPQAFRAAIDVLADRYRDQRLDRIVAIESRGFPFGGALSDRLGVGLAIARKPKKLPFRTIRKEYALEYGTDAIELHVDAVQPGQRVLVVDDLLATGGTAAAVTSLLQEMGAEVVECAFAIELKGLKGRDRLGTTPIFSLVAYEGA